MHDSHPRSAALAVSACLLAACTDASTSDETSETSTDEPPEWRRICDGSLGLKLAVRLVGHEQVPTEIGHELGSESLYIRGDCRYWASAPAMSSLPDWQVTRTGLLTAEREEQLSRALHYARWGELAGLYLGPGNPGGYEIQYSDSVSTIRCELGCTSDVDAPDELMALTAVARDWSRRLWDEGEPLGAEDPLRVDILRVELPEPVVDNHCAREWPFSFDPTPLARGMNDSLLSSRLLADGASAAELRALREQHLSGAVPPGTCNPPLQNSPFVFYEPAAPNVALSLWMRDAVPLEVAAGGVPLPDAQ
jgi:hypothetical protein